MHAYFWERVATSSDEEHGPLADHDAVVGLELAEEVPDRGLVVRRPGRRRRRGRRGEERLEVGLVLAMSYATAFMETLTISNFPYYDFEDRAMAYTVGSAFYGLYFVVSFPVYYALDEPGITHTRPN